MNPIIIEPAAFYRDQDLVKNLGLGPGSLEGARKRGELRFIKRGHLILYRGSDLLRWLDPAENPEPAGAVA